MIFTRDGHSTGSRSPKRRLRSGGGWVHLRCIVELSLCALISLVINPVDVQGFTGGGNLATTPIVRALANQAMTLLGDPIQEPSKSDGQAVANRPKRLNSDTRASMKEDAEPPATLSSSMDDAKGEPEKIDEKPIDTEYVGMADLDKPSHYSTLVASAPQVQKPRGEAAPVKSPRGSLIESIVAHQNRMERILVAKNASAVINLKMKADAVEIADPTIADVYLSSPHRIVLVGKSFGTTQMIIRIGKEQRAFHVDVELDLSLLNSFIRSISAESDVVARSVNGTIFVTGTVPNTDIAKQITEMASLVQGGEVRSNLTIVGVQQTLLRVVVAEVNKNAMRQLGVNWSIGGSSFSRDFFFANNLGQLNPTSFGSNGLADVTRGQQLFNMAPTATGPGTNVTFGFPRAEFQVFMNALRENSLSRTLAEPNLVAISGQTATFLAGGEVPIPVTQGGAVAGAITIQYKEFGVRLSFTPTVLNGQIIRLHVMTEVSEAVPTNQLAGGLPLFTFTTRRAESTIECGNGQTFAIAGLLNDQVRAMASKIPALGDLPILGTLFSSTNYERSITELVILVTPQLVEPLDPQQVPPPPGSLMTEPTDMELFTMQRLEGTPHPRPDSQRVPRDVYPVKTQSEGVTSWPTSQLSLRGPWGLAGFEEN